MLTATAEETQRPAPKESANDTLLGVLKKFHGESKEGEDTGQTMYLEGMMNALQEGDTNKYNKLATEFTERIEAKEIAESSSRKSTTFTPSHQRVNERELVGINTDSPGEMKDMMSLEFSEKINDEFPDISNTVEKPQEKVESLI